MAPHAQRTSNGMPTNPGPGPSGYSKWCRGDEKRERKEEGEGRHGKRKLQNEKRRCGSGDPNPEKPKKIRYLTSVVDPQRVMKQWIHSVKGSRFDWVPFMQFKLESVEGLPLVEKEDPKLLADGQKDVCVHRPPFDDLYLGHQTLDKEVTVQRYILSEEDSRFHRQWITFPLTWPDGCAGFRKYAAALIANARPATPQDCETVVDDANGARAPESVPAIFRGTDFRRTNLTERRVDMDKWSKWKRKWERRLSDKPVMFIEECARSRLDEAYKPPILDVVDIEDHLCLDVHMSHQVQDTRRFQWDQVDEYFSASISQLVESGRRAVKMLDIPSSTLLLPDVIRTVALDVVCTPLIEDPTFLPYTRGWNRCATQPALTTLHYDAGRSVTWVRCLRGTQIWFVLDGELPEEGLADFKVETGKFIYFVMEPGSLLVIPPGTPYAVLNVTDCIVEGGHMFLRSSLVKSFDVGLREHVLGHGYTNASHTLSEAMLHAIWKHYYLAIQAVLHKQEKADFDALQQSIRDLPSLENLLALIAMCIHPNAFEPTTPEGCPKTMAPWSLHDQRVSSRNYARRVSGIADLRDILSVFEDRIDAVEKKNGRGPIERWAW